MVGCVPTYCRNGRDFPKSNPGCRAGVATWPMKKAADKFEHARQLPFLRRQQPAYESGKGEGEIAPNWDSMAVSEERHGHFHIVESMDYSDSKR